MIDFTLGICCLSRDFPADDPADWVASDACAVVFQLCLARPNPMQICACAWINRWTKNSGKSGPGRRATGPPGRRAIAGREPVFSKTPFVDLRDNSDSTRTQAI